MHKGLLQLLKWEIGVSIGHLGCQKRPVEQSHENVEVEASLEEEMV